MHLITLSAPAVRALPPETIAVVPVASTEQHGPHLPVGTDAYIGQAVAEGLDAALGGRLLLAPMLPVGCSEHHMSFGGTLTLPTETFVEMVLGVVGSLRRHGLSRFLILNSHGGNITAGRLVAEKAAFAWPEAEVVFASWFTVAAAALAPLVAGEFPSVGHACEFETSLMLHLHPALVDMAKAADDGPAWQQPPFRADLLSGGAATWVKPFSQLTENGVIGKPTLASAEKGQRVLELAVHELVKMISVAWPDAVTK